ncbi:MAG: hypothetical protein JO333_00175 [Verrucomicrobia bacterium]|nr:hypothetical protein [Verrucomicrobiota bacterium]
MQSEAVSWAQEVAARLRMLQTSFADDSAATRQEYLAEEIERSLKNVVDNRRAAYLDALALRFPGPERIGIVPANTAPAPIEPVKRTVEELVEELLGRAAEFTEEGKARLVERFRSLGLLGEPDRGLDLPPELRGKLGLNPDQALDEERMNKLLAALLETVAALDQVTWNLWKTIAPKSVVRRPSGEGCRRIIGRYVSGDREVATLQITQMLERTRQLLAGLLSAIGTVGETFARRHLETFAPEKIRSTVDAASSGFLSNVEQKCWRRYLVLANELNGPAVEKQIVDAIVRYTEEIASGRKREDAEL